MALAFTDTVDNRLVKFQRVTINYTSSDFPNICVAPDSQYWVINPRNNFQNASKYHRHHHPSLFFWFWGVSLNLTGIPEKKVTRLKQLCGQVTTSTYAEVCIHKEFPLCRGSSIHNYSEISSSCVWQISPALFSYSGSELEWKYPG